MPAAFFFFDFEVSKIWLFFLFFIASFLDLQVKENSRNSKNFGLQVWKFAPKKC
jgi:hypothetical protein